MSRRKRKRGSPLIIAAPDAGDGLLALPSDKPNPTDESTTISPNTECSTEDHPEYNHSNGDILTADVLTTDVVTADFVNADPLATESTTFNPPRPASLIEAGESALPIPIDPSANGEAHQSSGTVLTVSDNWSEWPQREFTQITGRRQNEFQVIIAQSALNDIVRHGRANSEIEICGVVVGNVYRDANGPLLYIDAVIRGEKASGHTAQVTFTSETWSYIHEELEKHYADKKIAGWYHTHPGHGIFLSGMDLFIQENFFNLPWQVAYVYDPQGGDDGIFIWRNGQTVREKYLIDPNEVCLFGMRPQTEPDQESDAQLQLEQSRKESERWWRLPLLVLSGSFLIGLWVMSYFGSGAPAEHPATQPATMESPPATMESTPAPAGN